MKPFLQPKIKRTGIFLKTSILPSVIIVKKLNICIDFFLFHDNILKIRGVGFVLLFFAFFDYGLQTICSLSDGEGEVFSL